jgi:hypothetical protein
VGGGGVGGQCSKKNFLHCDFLFTFCMHRRLVFGVYIDVGGGGGGAVR